VSRPAETKVGARQSHPLVSSRYLTFVAIVVLVTGALHFYLWADLVAGPGLPSPWRELATGALGLLAVLLVAAMVWRRRFRRQRFLVSLLMTWLGVLFLLFTLLVVSDAVRLVVYVAGGHLSRPAVAVTVVALGAAAAVAAAIGARRLVVKPVEVTLARLPAELDGTTIVQITDLHIGPTLRRDFVADVVARVNALAPDVVAVTGDLVDGSVPQLRAAVAPLGDLRARWGVYFVTGNHEYYSGADPWVAELRRLGVHVLRNERVSIGLDPTASFDLAGVDDHSARGLARGHGEDLAGALAGRDPTRELVLLAHQPRTVLEAARRGVGLQLSGHTHGGQIWPWRYLVYLQQPFVSGLDRVGDTWIYTSCGTGYWGPPMRLGAPAEITRIVLRAGRRGSAVASAGAGA
jgi:uncharacterized protein